MQARCGEAGWGIVVRTFHSLCARILRSEAKPIGIPIDFVIFGEDDSGELLRTLLRGRPELSYLSPRDLGERIHRASVMAPAPALRLPPYSKALLGRAAAVAPPARLAGASHTRARDRAGAVFPGHGSHLWTQF